MEITDRDFRMAKETLIKGTQNDNLKQEIIT